jgi:hypothetical protein
MPDDEKKGKFDSPVKKLEYHKHSPARKSAVKKPAPENISDKKTSSK